MFDSISKTVVQNFSRNLKRAKENAEKHYSDESVDNLLETISHTDKYPSSGRNTGYIYSTVTGLVDTSLDDLIKRQSNDVRGI